MRETKVELLLGCVFIASACFMAYFPAIKGNFIWDDDRYVTDNPLVVAPDGLWRIWFSTDSPSQYFPLVYTTFRLEHKLWGFNPIPYHVDNVAIHVISSLLLWLILRRLAIPAAFVAAAIFALQPVNVESVAWITERKNVLMLVFSLLSLLFWIEFALQSQTPKRAILFYVLSLLCYALALFSKTTACVLPAALLLVLWLKNVPVRIKSLLAVIPYVLMGIAMGILAMWWEHQHQGTGLVDMHLSILDRLLIATRALWFYAGKIFFPANLTFSYPRWEINSGAPSQYIWLIACVLMAIGLWIWRHKFGRGVIVAFLFFVAALFPMLGFFDLYTFVYTWVADHYQYMASIALITLATAAGKRLISHFCKYAKMVATVVAAVLIITCASLTFKQAKIYTNLETIWSDTLKKNPDSWLAHNNLGQICFEQGKIDEDIIHITHAIDIAKRNPAVHPYSIASMRGNLAIAFQSQGRFQDAIDQLRAAIDIFPNDLKNYVVLADLLVSQNQLDEAIAYLNKATKIASNDETLHYHFAGILLKKGDISNVIFHLHRALDINPGYTPALDGLVGLFVNNPDTDFRRTIKAVEYARLAAQYTNRQNPDILNLLAMVLAADNQSVEAAATAKEALNRAIAIGATDLAEFLRTQLELYQKQLK
jgi:protein O-mannosyl-transferase